MHIKLECRRQWVFREKLRRIYSQYQEKDEYKQMRTFSPTPAQDKRVNTPGALEYATSITY